MLRYSTCATRPSSCFEALTSSRRGGDGLIVAHVGKLALKFTIRGFSLEELGIPRATAMPPAGHPRRTQFEAFNKELVDKSNGTLPEFEPNEIEILSGQKTHTRQYCRCVLKGAPCDDTRVATDGKYCMDKICSLRPSYAPIVCASVPRGDGVGGDPLGS